MLPKCFLKQMRIKIDPTFFNESKDNDVCKKGIEKSVPFLCAKMKGEFQNDRNRKNDKG